MKVNEAKVAKVKKMWSIFAHILRNKYPLDRKFEGKFIYLE